MLDSLSALKDGNSTGALSGIAGDGRFNTFSLRACTSLAERPAH